jgi:hypothetical protein
MYEEEEALQYMDEEEEALPALSSAPIFCFCKNK